MPGVSNLQKNEKKEKNEIKKKYQIAQQQQVVIERTERKQWRKIYYGRKIEEKKRFEARIFCLHSIYGIVSVDFGRSTTTVGLTWSTKFLLKQRKIQEIINDR